MVDAEHLDDLGVGLPPSVGLPRQAGITGQIVKIEEAYPREVPVSVGLVASLLAGATVTRLLILALAAVVRGRAGPGDGRGFRALRKGPEFRVTPVWIRDTDGLFVEVEIHGYLSGRALCRGDHIRVTALRQGSRDLPMRADRIDNLTIGRTITPRRPTVWTHLGPGLIIQATLGLVVCAAVAIWLWTGG